MAAISYFNDVWNRCEHLCAIHAYIANNVAGALQPDEILRAEWVARVSALDLYVHELVTEGMVKVFSGSAAPTAAYLKFKLTNETTHRIKNATSESDQLAAFELDVRQQFSILTFQDPEKIADAIRLVSGVELWNEVAIKLGATPTQKIDAAKDLKKTLSLIVSRRNKIAHEGDLQPTVPRTVWPISQADVREASDCILKIVNAIDALVV